MTPSGSSLIHTPRHWIPVPKSCFSRATVPPTFPTAQHVSAIINQMFLKPKELCPSSFRCSFWSSPSAFVETASTAAQAKDSQNPSPDHPACRPLLLMLLAEKLLISPHACLSPDSHHFSQGCSSSSPSLPPSNPSSRPWNVFPCRGGSGYFPA